MESGGGNRSPRILSKLLAGAMLVVNWTHAKVPDAEGTPASEFSAAGRAALEKSLARELQASADRQSMLPGQRKIDISVNLLVGTRRMVIDLGRDSVPTKAGAASEDQCSALVTEAMSIINGIVSVNGYSCTYGGRDIYYYHPEPALPPRRTISNVSAQEHPPVIVMVSGGHGYFFNQLSGTWQTRRPLMDGMQEDFVTPYFARDVSSELISANLSVAKARSNGSSNHGASGYAWWRMSARTWLQNQLPHNPEVWDSLSNDADPGMLT